MTNRTGLARIARDTLDIIERGEYVAPNGMRVSIAAWQAHAEQHSALYRPEEFDEVMRRRDALLAESPSRSTRFEVLNTTTLEAARGQLAADSQRDLLCLNFASAKNPGGGFLGGSRAQEESLARSSGLYPCINPMQEMYQTNRALRSCLYTDHMIYSPQVPVICDDEGRLLDEPYRISILTAPAVNAGAVRKNRPQDAPRIAPMMIERMEKLLSVAVLHGHAHLVLGAWGCGVFKNDPADVAEWFHQFLAGDHVLSGAFETVTFAVTDWSDERRFVGPFQQRFG